MWLPSTLPPLRLHRALQASHGSFCAWVHFPCRIHVRNEAFQGVRQLDQASALVLRHRKEACLPHRACGLRCVRPHALLPDDTRRYEGRYATRHDTLLLCCVIASSASCACARVWLPTFPSH